MKILLLTGKLLFSILLISLFGLSLSCVSRGTAQAEEYFSIGMAYFDLGKYTEAEQWLNRAKLADKTMTASEYNLGRIAFETGRYDEAAQHFENILSKDPDNIMALKSAAYSRIRNGDLGKAEALYDRVLALVPESADEGFNYALVLYGLAKFEKCEEVLNRYPYSLEENAASILLLARAQKAQGKVEAADSYAKWLSTGKPGAQGLYEYAQVLENTGLYARALEQYRDTLKVLVQDTPQLKKSEIRFNIARLLFIADPENAEGLTELNTSISEGFSDKDAIGSLLADERISLSNREEIKTILNTLLESKQQGQAGTDSTQK